MRPRSRIFIVSMKPASTSPMRFESGTRQFSNVSSAVSLERQPSLSRCLLAAKPGVP